MHMRLRSSEHAALLLQGEGMEEPQVQIMAQALRMATMVASRTGLLPMVPLPLGLLRVVMQAVRAQPMVSQQEGLAMEALGQMQPLLVVLAVLVMVAVGMAMLLGGSMGPVREEVDTGVVLVGMPMASQLQCTGASESSA